MKFNKRRQLFYILWWLCILMLCVKHEQISMFLYLLYLEMEWRWSGGDGNCIARWLHLCRRLSGVMLILASISCTRIPIRRFPIPISRRLHAEKKEQNKNVIIIWNRWCCGRWSMWHSNYNLVRLLVVFSNVCLAAVFARARTLSAFDPIQIVVFIFISWYGRWFFDDLSTGCQSIGAPQRLTFLVSVGASSMTRARI